MSDFDLAKVMANGGRCQTRDGRPARIVCTDAIGRFPIVALVLDPKEEEECPREYTLLGKFHTNCDSYLDLVNTAERHVRWINICVRIEFEEGEGL